MMMMFSVETRTDWELAGPCMKSWTIRMCFVQRDKCATIMFENGDRVLIITFSSIHNATQEIQAPKPLSQVVTCQQQCLLEQLSRYFKLVFDVVSIRLIPNELVARSYRGLLWIIPSSIVWPAERVFMLLQRQNYALMNTSFCWESPVMQTSDIFRYVVVLLSLAKFRKRQRGIQKMLCWGCKSLWWQVSLLGPPATNTPATQVMPLSLSVVDCWTTILWWKSSSFARRIVAHLSLWTKHIRIV